MNVPAILNSGSTIEAYKKAISNHAKNSLPENLPKGVKTGISNSLNLLPVGLSETLVIGNFINGISQSIQEAMMQLIPRAGAGMIIRNTPLIAVDEAILELFQYLFSFILTTSIGVSLAKPLSHSLGIPHYEMLGKPVHELEKHLGKSIEVGTIKPQKIKITKDVLGKVSLAKLALFSMLGFYCFCMEFLSSSLKVLAVDKIFGTSNFYTISGLNEKSDENKDEGDHAIKQAKINLGNLLIALPLTLLCLFGLGKLAGKSSKIKNSQFINKASKLFDLSDKFGHPKTLVAISVLTAGLFAYPSVARNKAEELEVKFRVLCYSTPMALFFKQIIGNFRAWITGLSMGLGNILAPPQNYFKEINEGSRNIFDLGLVGIQKNKGEEFSGRITSLEAMQNLKRTNKEKYQKALKRIHFMDHRAPYWMALLAGIGVSWVNYLRTAQIHKHEQSKKSQGISVSQQDSNNIANKTIPPKLGNFASLGI